ncbi:F5/8 type C domain-containing protein [Methylobacterium sp. ap11]|uniref:glycosyltransferase family 2 protein n=1 Tax=Methylobacterium sp. ap11 TaxID=1761799 RepID=UPI0008C37F48|nr:glycosyltransferase family 2 protein [Methylobacterium sp. ap11]SEP36972.1 F5/8 type C domain-containing protein [Methylobacterium sp. ap11]
MNYKYEHAVVACARWERSYIVEWVEYHLSLGFDHIYLYSNDDDFEEIFPVLLPYIRSEKPLVTLKHYPYLGQQAFIYRHFLQNFRHQTRWATFIDIDEFLNLRGATIKEFTDRYDEDVFSIYFNWIYFGTSGFKTRTNKSVLRSYNKRCNIIHPYTKNIFRTAFVRDEMLEIEALHAKHFWHGWYKFATGGGRVINVINENMINYYDNFPDAAIAFLAEDGRQEKIMSVAIIHHYCMRSEEDFQIRVDRGTVGNFTGQVMWAEVRRNGRYIDILNEINAVEDNSLVNYWDKRAQSSHDIVVVPPARGANLAESAAATQSSVSQWSRDPSSLEADAAGVLRGHPTGTYSHSTSEERSPWWQADLQHTCDITELRVFNRLDEPGAIKRLRSLVIEISGDGIHYDLIHSHDWEVPIGGVDGNPLIVRLEAPVRARLVRLSLQETTLLHLDKVQIFGTYSEA